MLENDTTDQPKYNGDGAAERLFDALGQSDADGKPPEKPPSRGIDGWGDRVYDAWKRIGLAMIQSTPTKYQDAVLQSIGMPPMAKWLQGQTIQHSMQTIGLALPGHGELYDPAYNHKMLAEDGTGTVRAVEPKQFYQLFPQASEEDPYAESRWPRLVLTSHHARGGSLKDMTSITHGIESLMKQCFKTNGHEKHFAPLQFEVGDLWNSEAPQQSQRTKLMIAYACDVDRNPFLNGAAMLRRIEELGHLHGKTTQDRYVHASQSAFRLAKVMLQCLVDEPERIDPNFYGRLLNQPNFSDKPLHLRADAAHVAQHLSLIGYSKGGNVVSDAMRILLDELMQKRENGESLFYVQEQTRFEHTHASKMHYVPIHSHATQKNPLQGAKNILRHIPLLSLASIEVPLSERMEMAGVRRVNINSHKDFISGHTQLRRSQGADEVIWVDGVRDFLGHAPSDALGTRDTKGYILNNEAARRRIEEYACALYGASAIASAQFHYDDQFAGENRLALIPAPGTSDSGVLNYCPVIARYMEEAGFTGVHVGPTEWNPSQILVSANEPFFNDIALTRMAKQGGKQGKAALSKLDDEIEAVAGNIEKLGEVFRKIRKTEPGLVVNQAIDAQIEAHYRHEVDGVGQAHTQQTHGQRVRAARERSTGGKIF